MIDPDARSTVAYIIPPSIMAAYTSPRKAAAFLNSKLRKHHVITVILSTTGATWKQKAF